MKMRAFFEKIFLCVSFVMALILMPVSAEGAGPILIGGAMECETSLLIESLDHPVEQQIAGWRFVSGEFEGIPVVVSVTSIGMTNAAAATTLGMEYFHPMAVINQGTAGGHDPSLHTFDIVLGANTFDGSAYMSYSEQTGADGRHIELLPTLYYDSNRMEYKKEIGISCDPDLMKAALAEAENYQAGRVVSGKICTGNTWNRQLDRIRYFHEKYGSSCEEMESHTVAHVCRNYGVPFLAIRILSNSELHDENFNPDTGRACQQYVLTVVKAYVMQMAKAQGASNTEST